MMLERATGRTRKCWVHTAEVFERQAEEIVFYSVSDEEILKVKADSDIIETDLKPWK